MAEYLLDANIHYWLLQSLQVSYQNKSNVVSFKFQLALVGRNVNKTRDVFATITDELQTSHPLDFRIPFICLWIVGQSKHCSHYTRYTTLPLFKFKRWSGIFINISRPSAIQDPKQVLLLRQAHSSYVKLKLMLKQIYFYRAITCDLVNDVSFLSNKLVQSYLHTYTPQHGFLFLFFILSVFTTWPVMKSNITVNTKLTNIDDLTFFWCRTFNI